MAIFKLYNGNRQGREMLQFQHFMDVCAAWLTRYDKFITVVYPAEQTQILHDKINNTGFFSAEMDRLDSSQVNNVLIIRLT